MAAPTKAPIVEAAQERPRADPRRADAAAPHRPPARPLASAVPRRAEDAARTDETDADPAPTTRRARWKSPMRSEVDAEAPADGVAGPGAEDGERRARTGAGPADPRTRTENASRRRRRGRRGRGGPVTEPSGRHRLPGRAASGAGDPAAAEDDVRSPRRTGRRPGPGAAAQTGSSVSTIQRPPRSARRSGSGANGRRHRRRPVTDLRRGPEGFRPPGGAPATNVTSSSGTSASRGPRAGRGRSCSSAGSIRLT